MLNYVVRVVTSVLYNFNKKYSEEGYRFSAHYVDLCWPFTQPDYISELLSELWMNLEYTHASHYLISQTY